jgi:hypothetical protein
MLLFVGMIGLGSTVAASLLLALCRIAADTDQHTLCLRQRAPRGHSRRAAVTPLGALRGHTRRARCYLVR